MNFLDSPEPGRISIGGLELDAATASKADILTLRRRTAFVFQNYALFANKTARENITEALIVVKKRSRESSRIARRSVFAFNDPASKTRPTGAASNFTFRAIGVLVIVNDERTTVPVKQA